ncbi:ATP-binding protein [Streptomyces adelaidensis]|uniref:ATP-binding protein n=1 Tax=Streptomyces adelaidensis TaxID=2796465 RepID=UPI0035579B0B
MTRTQLTGWALCEDTCDTAALVVSELVTNAIVHTASTHVVCELHDGDDLVRIAVRDEGCAPGEPHPSPQRPEEEHGRGLLLIEALCRSWGAQPAGLGLLVWADVPRSVLAGPAVGAMPADAMTADAMTAGAMPAGAMPTAAIPTAAIPTAAIPTAAIPTAAIPTAADIAAADIAARSDLGWGAKKRPPEERDDGAEALRRTGADGRVQPRTGAEWV